MRSPRRLGVLGVALLTAVLVACAPSLPASVVPDTSVAVGWAGELTSFNAAAQPTSGNLDIAAATRGSFGATVDGDFVPDESFGTVAIVREEPFTVRYDLAEPSWSDGIPVDAADLLLAWAAPALAAVDIAPDAADEATPDEAETDRPAPPTVDEFARAIDVTSPAPSLTWQSALTVAVPAHVVGERAFGLDDPMAAKQAVIRAIQDDDVDRMAAIAAVWGEEFAVDDEGDPDADLLLSSGPYRVDAVVRDDAGQRVVLVPNAAYRGAPAPQVARVELVPPGDDAIAAVGDALDMVSVLPTAQNREPIRERERRDFAVQTTHDGTVWSVVLATDGVFANPAARAAFLRVVPVREMIDAGAGEWAPAYTTTTSLVSAPGSRAFDIVTEDSGFTAALGTPAEDPALDREAAGIAAGTGVCVLYDRGSAFASGAFAALRDAAGEVGWGVADCGSDDVAAARAQGGWDAVIERVPVPRTPAQLAAQWGTGGAASVAGDTDAERDGLISQLSGTVDVYAARDLLAQIEATIVRAAVVRPIAANPRVTVIAPRVTGVTVRNGPVAPLLSGIAQWAPVP